MEGITGDEEYNGQESVLSTDAGQLFMEGYIWELVRRRQELRAGSGESEGVGSNIVYSDSPLEFDSPEVTKVFISPSIFRRRVLQRPTSFVAPIPS